jgi:hypothetical protein
MNKYNTTFGQLLSLVKRPEFDKLCMNMNADKYCKDFTTRDRFVVMTFAQITGQHGLRSIENALNSQTNSFYHLGLDKEVKRSTISYVNKKRSPDFFEALYYQLHPELPSGTRKAAVKKLYAVDATTIGLCMKDFPWAKFRSTKSGVKVHVKYDIDEAVPEYLFITNADKHENNTLKEMKLKKGDTATFDKGYNNYTQFSRFCREGIYFVTRLKDNADYRIMKPPRSKLRGILRVSYPTQTKLTVDHYKFLYMPQPCVPDFLYILLLLFHHHALLQFQRNSLSSKIHRPIIVSLLQGIV